MMIFQTSGAPPGFFAPQGRLRVNAFSLAGFIWNSARNLALSGSQVTSLVAVGHLHSIPGRSYNYTTLPFNSLS